MGAVIRAIFGYVFLLFIVRIVGRRPGRQMTPFEFVLIFFIGGLTLSGMVGDDRSLTNALIQIATIAVMHFVIAWLRTRSIRFGLIVDGTPLVLLEKGKWRKRTMKKMALQDDDVMAAARDKGLERLDQIEFAVLERNAEISVIAAQENN
jgi:uncharacterized membrane protein YcaP (DUF421 family)